MIRNGTKHDMPYFIDIVKQIHKRGEIGNYDILLEDNYLNALYVTALYTGIILIAERDDEIIGILVAMISPNIWNDKVYVMNQLLIYVDEDHRYGKVGYLLLQEYDEICKHMVKEKRIHHYTLNSAKNMQDIDFSRFGYENIASTWLKVGD